MVGTDFLGNGGLPAPIIEVADSGDYQQVTVQVPWEYQRYIVSSTGITTDGQQYAVLSQRGVVAQTVDYAMPYPVSPFFEDQNGYALAQHSTDLSWVTPSNPAHPGEVIILHAANLGPVVNPPPTGFPTPPYFSTVYSEQGKLSGPIRLDTSHSEFTVGVADLSTQNTLAGLQVLSITLEPGVVSRYLVVAALPGVDRLPKGITFGVFGRWLFCPGVVENVFPVCRQGRLFSSSGTASRIALVVP